MVREKVKVSEFDRITYQHEYFLWNFLPDEMECLSMISYFQDIHPCSGEEINPIKEVLNLINIPYFESRVEDSIDFILNSGVLLQDKVYSDGKFSPVIMGFKRRRKVTSTLDGVCYCPEGVIEIVYKLNPNFIMNVNLD